MGLARTSEVRAMWICVQNTNGALECLFWDREENYVPSCPSLPLSPNSHQAETAASGGKPCLSSSLSPCICLTIILTAVWAWIKSFMAKVLSFRDNNAIKGDTENNIRSHGNVLNTDKRKGATDSRIHGIPAFISQELRVLGWVLTDLCFRFMGIEQNNGTYICDGCDN